MTVGVKVGAIVDEVGAPSFLNCFFSTITGLLEGGHRGGKFPVVTEKLYAGEIAAEDVKTALKELGEIKELLRKFDPSAVIWDLENTSAHPPWGNNISPDITNMSNYFVSSTGRDLFELLEEAFQAAQDEKTGVQIVQC